MLENAVLANQWVRPRMAERLFILAAATSSLVTVRLAVAVTVTDALLLTCAVFTALRLLASGTLPPSARSSPMPASWSIFVFLIASGGFLSSARAVDPTASLGITLRLLVVTAVLPLLAWLLMRHEIDLVRAGAALAIAGALQGAAAILQVMGFESSLFGNPQYGRYTGFAGHPNDLGAALAITLPVSLISIFILSKRRLVLALLVLAFLATVAGLLLSGSLSAIAGGIAGVITALFVLRGGNRSSKRWAMYGVTSLTVALLLLFLLIFYGPTVGSSERIAVVKDPKTRLAEVVGSQGTLETRLRTVESAVEDIAQNPLIGTGFDHESSDVFEGGQVHSMLILAWHAGGLLVFAGLFSLLCLSCRIAWPGKASMSRRLRAIRAGLLGATCAMIVNGIPQPFLYKRFGWIPVALIFSQPILARAVRPGRDTRTKTPPSAGVSAAPPMVGAQRQ